MQTGRGLSLLLIAICQMAAMALWFSASAIVPVLRAEIGLDGLTASLFTSAVQAGFVAGTLISAFFGLADTIDPRRFFMMSSLVAAAANAAILLVAPTSFTVIVLRFVTGMCMAGIYPIGMKLATTWAKGDMGLLVGLLVGALAVGSAAPHLFNALGGVDWRFTLGAASFSALAAAVGISFVRIGPNFGRAPPFDPAHALAGFRIQSLRLANIGYLGHMWELFAMWAWIGVFLNASFVRSMADGTAAATYAALATFAIISAGGAGCVLGGLFADRMGRTTLTILAMAVSGTCALVVGFLFGGNPAWLVALCIVWGFAVVADSPQFSASVAELSDRNLVGTMLTVQTSMGFLLTLATIHMIPWLVETVTWRYAFAVLALGPLVGVVAMARLRAHPDAVKLANGRK
jgi:MFS family permease